MNVLHILSCNTFSGAENVACQIIRMFDNDKSIESAYTSPDGPIAEALRDRNVTFLPLKELSLKELRRVIKGFKPDLIHAHDMGATFKASLICGSIPLISHIHNNNFNSRKFNLKSIAYLLSTVKSRHIIWVSRSACEGYFFKKVIRKKSSILSNVINLQEIKDKAKKEDVEQFDVISVGRITYPKNPLRMVKVLKKLINRMPDIKVGIIGTGEMEEDMKSLVTKNNLNSNIKFLGYQKNPFPYIQKSKVMLMTSLWEGTPMTCLESMCLGTPIVSTPVDGLINIIQSGKNGYLGKEDDELVNYLYEIITNKEKREYLSQNAKLFSQEYNNLQIYKKKIEDIYNV